MTIHKEERPGFSTGHISQFKEWEIISFTIKCNKCGVDREFTNDSKKYQGETVSVDVYVTGTYMGDAVQSIEIDCENPMCNNGIEINY